MICLLELERGRDLPASRADPITDNEGGAAAIPTPKAIYGRSTRPSGHNLTGSLVDVLVAA